MAGNSVLVSCCLGVVLLVSVILFAVSFSTIGPLEAGIKINKVTSTVSGDKIYTAGRYFLGLGNGFLTYPTTLQMISFSDNAGSNSGTLKASTRDGQSITIDLSFQFRLKISQIGKLYSKYEKNYINNFITIAESTLKNLVSQKYSTDDYFTRREAIQEVMIVALNQAFASQFAVVELLQLRRIKPPAATETIIVSKLVSQQNNLLRIVERNSTLIRADTSIVQQTAQTSITVIQAESQSSAKKIIETNNAEVIRILNDAKSTSYQYLMTTMNYTSTDLLNHVWLDSVRQLPSRDSLVVGVDSTLVK